MDVLLIKKLQWQQVQISQGATTYRDVNMEDWLQSSSHYLEMYVSGNDPWPRDSLAN
jgi:hypothetical protein